MVRDIHLKLSDTLNQKLEQIAKAKGKKNVNELIRHILIDYTLEQEQQESIKLLRKGGKRR